MASQRRILFTPHVRQQEIARSDRRNYNRTAFIVRPSSDVRLKKRSSLDIISTILEAANGGIGKTRLLEKANLTTAQFEKYLQLLVSKKLVEKGVENGRPRYKTTEMGLRYVELYSALKNSLYLNPMSRQ